MKIGFFGTPEIAAFCFEHLIKYYEIAFAVTSPDKPKGRGKHMTPPPVKEKAIAHGIPCFQPVTLKDETLRETLLQFNCEIFVVVAYGKLIPQSIFSIPPHGTINLHPSLLPKYRGAAPVEWALYNGEQQTGVTVQLINQELDAGDIVLQSPVTIAPDDTAQDVYDKILPIGVDLLIKAINGLHDGTITPVPQDHSQATYCGKITSETAHINWNMSARSIHNLVRAFNPKPVAWTTFRGKIIKIWKTAVGDSSYNYPTAQPGTLIHQAKRLFVCTGDGTLEVLILQPETKKPMDAAAFLNGYRLQEKDAFI
ncbi:MAG: methionyl-tRNA formyltransferase [Spirochaetes bacterium]|nr:methionyl-tRNA formyltransferase [Spirochaetota bacterium]